MTTYEIFGIRLTKKKRAQLAKQFRGGVIRVKQGAIKSQVFQRKKQTSLDRAIKEYEQKGYYTTDLKGRFNKGGIRIKHYQHPLQRNTADVNIQHQKPTRQVSLDTAIKRNTKNE